MEERREYVKVQFMDTAEKRCFWFKKVVFVFLIFLFSLSSLYVVFAQQLAVSTVRISEAPPPVTNDLFLRGKTLYEKQCMSCHGAEGKGDGRAAYLLYPKPRDFTGGEFRLVSTVDAGPTDQDLFKVITRGMPGSAMPPWEYLSEKERWSLVYYVRYLSELGPKMRKKEFRERVEAQGLSWDETKALMSKEFSTESLVKVPTEPSVTPQSVDHGRELYKVSCAGCHGAEGRGDGQQEMVNTDGLPTKPRDLTSGLFKGSSSSEDLYVRFVAGLPGSPMPSYFYSLTEQEIWDIIHFVQTLSNPEKEARSRLAKHRIEVGNTKSEISLDPASSIWNSVEPTFATLTPLWWRNERIEGVDVRALRSGDQIAVHLSWVDATKDDGMVAPQLFSDGAAIQFSTEKDPPFFAMGSAETSAVTIWHWKASWQSEKKEWADIEMQYPHVAVDWYPSDQQYAFGGHAFEASESKTEWHEPELMTGQGAGNPLSNPKRESSAEEAEAKGFGSLTTVQPTMEKVDAEGIWKDGQWQVVFRRALAPSEKDRIGFTAGQTINVAFAVWDGKYEDRNGQKMVSIWNELHLEE